MKCVYFLIFHRPGITGAMSYSMNGSSNILDFLRTDGIVERADTDDVFIYILNSIYRFNCFQGSCLHVSTSGACHFSTSLHDCDTIKLVKRPGL